ncbi:MAG: hypothetical protein WA939_14150 [Nodosilinea sp.]
MATHLWNFLTTDVQALDATDRLADAADVVLSLAAVLAAEGPSSQKLAPLVNRLDSLLDAINSPLGKLIGATLPLVPIGTGLLQFYVETTKKEPTLAQSVALVSQAAYLESFREFARQHPKIEQWLTAKDGTPQAKTITLPVKALGIFELTDQSARLTMLHFHQSDLAQAFSSALRARLVQLGATPEQAHRMTEVVAKNTNRHLRNAIAAAKDSFQHRFDCDRP